MKYKPVKMLNSHQIPKLQFTCILIEDPVDNGYTAFFAEFPELVVEGDTEEEAELNLLNSMSAVFKHKRQELETEHLLQNYKSKSLNFELEGA
jgi:predicted RNase H-like HicB family nuclease